MSEEDFVTVVSVEDAPYVTVVEVQEPLIRTTGTEETSAVSPPLQEDIHIYRLPGERLGFGLKFDGGPTVSSLTVESTAEGSPSARARASWGPLAPGDSILAVDNRPVAEMSRQEVVTRLTESGLVVKLRVRRGPPPVPPRRHCKPRLTGPPPPPRPLPRAPPRLVDFLPKDSSRPPEVLPSEFNEFKCPVSEMQQETDTSDEKGLYPGKRTNTDPQTERIQLEDDLKEKIIPLKNLNPKLISLFEHWQPTDNIVKTSQNLQFNNNNKFCLNDDKSRRSIKDKIALFSSEVENNSESKSKKLELNEQNEVSNKSQIIGETASFLEIDLESSYNLCNRININESCDIVDNKDNSNVLNNMNNKSISPFISGKNDGVPNREDSEVSVSVNSFQPSLIMKSQCKENTEDAFDKSDVDKDGNKVTSVNSKVNNTTSLVPEPRKKSLTGKEKTLTKLRGLVIPQTPSEIPSKEQIFDLPEIKSSALLTKSELFDGSSVSHKQDESSNVNYNDTPHPNQKFQSTVTIVKPSLEWKPQFENELPKYSPAFKRKALSVFEIKSNFAENNTSNDNELSHTKFGNALLLPLNAQDETKLLCLKTSKEHELKHENTSEDLIHSSTFNSVDPEEHKEAVESSFTTKESSIKDADYPLDCRVSTKENNTEPNSLTSHNSLSFNIAEPDKSKQCRDGKFDSLLSQDMSDSGNHSIPSICSKSKYDSSDESISSIGNSDSDHASLGSSSEEGQFIEFNYNESKNEVYPSTENDKGSKSFTKRSNCLNETKTLVASLLPVASVDNEEVVNGKEQVTALKKEISSVNDGDEIRAFFQDMAKEYPENLNEFPLKLSLNEKINPSTLSQYKQLELKEYNNDIISKDTIIDENISSLSSPLGDLQKDNHFASITSLASSTSLISHQELCQLIEESNDSSLDESSGTRDISVIVLHRDSAEGSIGITLAGGIDYECKDIMVHKVLSGSPADKDGRIKKGHRILSINGKSMKGLTHLESLAVLKAPRHEVVLVVAKSQGYLFEENNNVPKNVSQHSAELNVIPATSYQQAEEAETRWGPVVTVTLLKEGAGLGFSLKGGKDSPNGDQPLTVQKIFTGGCAEKSKQIFAGDELLSINQYDLNGMTRVETWTLMKRLPDGQVTLKLRHSAH